MTTIQKTTNGNFIFRNDNMTIKAMFDMGKIWLTKKEVADVYGVKKSEIKKELNDILLNSSLDLSDNIKKIYNEKRDKLETFYSLDVLLLLGYRSKHFKETKFLVNTNKILKEYTGNRQFRTKTTEKQSSIFNKIFNYFHKTV